MFIEELKKQSAITLYQSMDHNIIVSISMLYSTLPQKPSYRFFRGVLLRAGNTVIRVTPSSMAAPLRMLRNTLIRLVIFHRFIWIIRRFDRVPRIRDFLVKVILRRYEKKYMNLPIRHLITLTASAATKFNMFSRGVVLSIPFFLDAISFLYLLDIKLLSAIELIMSTVASSILTNQPDKPTTSAKG